uniref:Glycoprotein endo-alpha-1,2-mannosidase n=1 Tax=Strongyloides venezuelensis TaxID=75913 RepID=A0A0K0FZY8_STRVS
MRAIQTLKFLILCTLIFTFYLGFVAIMNTNNIRKFNNFQKMEEKRLSKVLVDEHEEININIIENKEKIIYTDVITTLPEVVKPEISTKKTPDKKVEKMKTTTTTTTTTQVVTEKKTVQTTKISSNITRVINEKDHTSAPIHIFYYPWYGTPKFDNGSYYHWNHHVLRKWDDPSKEPLYYYKPPYEIASVFYPQLGAYSSRNLEVIEKHMKMISSAGIDAVAISWFPKAKADSEGKPWEDMIKTYLDIAVKYKLKITFHMEPYKGRTIESIHDDIKYVIDTYGKHNGFYRQKPKKVEVKKGSSFEKDAKDIAQLEKPVFYIYDSYLINSSDWYKMTSLNGSLTIRHTMYDSILIGLLVKENDQLEILKSGFDGIYTYFASDGFSYGSTMSNWMSLSEFCEKNDLLFVPSVGPGYNDERVRPWNSINTKERNGGEYYKDHFKEAHTARADIVSITSFNEWHEGTQIEPAVPFTDTKTHPKHPYKYESYSKEPEQYLHITFEMIKLYFTPHSKDIEARLGVIV